jgi:tetratricopeptide (TPR) repeat protein
MRMKLVILFSSMLWAACVVAAESADSLYLQAEQKYQAQHYKDAAALLKRAVAIAPEISRLHHLLGKCYGRMAESAGVFQAFSLATKTRQQFEKAVELDGDNIGALEDLMQYYRDAPGFLGGSSKKAGKIEEKLSRLRTGKRQGASKTRQQKDLDSSVMYPYNRHLELLNRAYG